MSSSPTRSRDINIDDGTTSPYQLYWCYHCNRTVRIASNSPSEIVCPRCFGQFLSEIDMSIRPRLLVDYTSFDPSPEARLLEALSLMFEPFTRPFNRELFDPEADPGGRRHHEHEGGGTGIEPEVRDLWTNRRRRRRRNRSFDGGENWELEPEPRTRNRPRTWTVVRPVDDPYNPVGPTSQTPENPILPVPRGVDLGNYFFGPGFQGLIEELTQNDRPGPPPLPESAINAIPTVEISEAHLINDSCCPICMEEFKVGGAARELPCNHIFHSECIIPWLRLHNSCPVCRVEIPVPGGVLDESEGSNSGGERRGRRSRLGSLWPSRARYRRMERQGGNATSTSGAGDPWWSSCTIL
ncbi:E3 ubiquitin-protein ligase RING1-like isoform X1 [Malus sylvestris]|uniref:E3 ubiquitin-protein ligase RING1-like isoform X1 n=1 Tax=Malus sylvestris TaxID=3752 RepID=UPI0021ACC996|nr:E3 ubiquitin-protein ligase RING1-like isoform X1 [Malus sylvestris]